MHHLQTCINELPLKSIDRYASNPKKPFFSFVCGAQTMDSDSDDNFDGEDFVLERGKGAAARRAPKAVNTPPRRKPAPASASAPFVDGTVAMKEASPSPARPLPMNDDAAEKKKRRASMGTSMRRNRKSIFGMEIARCAELVCLSS